MQIIAADAEIERPAEIRGQPEFLAELPGMFVATDPAADQPCRSNPVADRKSAVRRRSQARIERRRPASPSVIPNWNKSPGAVLKRL